MARSAAKADGGITLTAVIARRKKDGALVLLETKGEGPYVGPIVEHVLNESSDRALDLYQALKNSRDRSHYSHVSLFLRSKTPRRLKFG